MEPERWKQIDSLLQSVLEHRPDEREAFLRQACSGDQALEREVRSLLKAQLKSGNFLESPAIEAAAMAIAKQNKDPRGTNSSQAASSFPITALWESSAVVGWVSFIRPRTRSWVALSP